MKELQRMLDSIEFIQRNLSSNLHMDEVASVACMSKFHFQRMFHMLTGYTLNAYIHNRRITVATKELINSKAKVIDVALKYGYETPESFTKAFRRIHGVSPINARKNIQ